MGMTNITEPMDQTIFDTIIQATILAVIIVISVFGNALVLLGFYRYKPLQTVTNAFVVSLAVTDFCFGLFGMPFSLVTSVTVDWVFDSSMCQYHGFVLLLFSEASIWTLVSVSLERYLAIRHPFHHQRWTTPVTVFATISLVWIIAVVLASLPFGISKFVFYKPNHICMVDWRISFQTTLVYCTITAFIPLSLMSVLNFGVLKTALEQNRKMDVKIGNVRKVTVDAVGVTEGDADVQGSAEELEEIQRAKNRKKKETRATVLVLVIVCAFAICWLPYTVTAMCYVIKGYQCLWSSRFFVASVWLCNLNSALNPILYAVFNVAFRRGMKQVLGIRISTNSIGVGIHAVTTTETT